MNASFSLILVMMSTVVGICQNKSSYSFNFDNISLVSAIESLEDEYNLRFSYSDDLVQGIKVRISLNSPNLDFALRRLFRDTGLDFEIIDKKYILLSKSAISTNEANSITLCGVVKDAVSYDPLPGASIFEKNRQLGTNTDTHGSFNWSLDPKTIDTVYFQYLGYNTLAMASTDIRSGHCADILLRAKPLEIGSILIREYLTAGIGKDLHEDFVTISPNNLDIIPGSVEPDLLQSVQLLPGVNSPDESASGLSIRGGSPDQNLIIWNDITVYNSGHFFGMISSFDSHSVKDIKVFRSNFGSEYGGRVAGVIDMQSDKGIPLKTQGGIGLNLTHANAHIHLPIVPKKSSINFTIRRSITDVTETPTFNSLANKVFSGTPIEEEQTTAQEDPDDFTTTNRFWFADANLHWQLYATPSDYFSVSAFQTQNKMEYQTQNFLEDLDTRDQLVNKHSGLNFLYRKSWNANNETTFRATLSDYEFTYEFNLFDLENVDSVSFDSRRNNINDKKIRVQHSYQPDKLISLDAGYIYNEFNILYELDILSEGDDFYEFNEQVNDLHTLYSDILFQWNDQVSTGLGFRVSRYSQLDEWLTEPRLSFRIRPTSFFSLKASASIHYQFIYQLVEFDLTTIGLNNELWVMADNETIPFIKSNHLSVGLDYSKDGYSVDFEMYAKSVDGITSLATNLGNIAALEDNFVTGKSNVNGMDLLIRKKWSKHNAWLSYSLSSTKYTFPEIANSEFRASIDQRHSLSLTYGYSSFPWDVGTKITYGSGRPFTPSNGLKSFENDETGELDFLIDYGPINSSNLPYYFRWDFSAAMNFPHHNTGNFQGKVAISIINILDRRNVSSREYVIDHPDLGVNTPDLFLLDRNLLGFTPNLSLTLNWK